MTTRRSIADALASVESLDGMTIDLGVQGQEASAPKTSHVSPDVVETSDDLTVVDVAYALEYGTDTVPEYAPYRTAAEVDGPRWLRAARAAVRRYVQTGDANVLEGQLRQLGVAMTADQRATIVEIDTPPNAQETIDRKGSDNPMIDTGQFLNSQRAEVTIPGAPPFIVG